MLNIKHSLFFLLLQSQSTVKLLGHSDSFLVNGYAEGCDYVKKKDLT